MWIVLGSIVCSAIVSVVITKKLATHYFNIVDGYVDDMTKKTKEFVDVMKRTKE